MDDKNKKIDPVKKIGGYLHKVVPVFDNTGKIINYAVKPLMVEFRFRDVMQIIIGSVILAIPVGVTEEVWTLAEQLPFRNVMFFAFFSLFFIAFFVYFNYYKGRIRKYGLEFLKRVFTTYGISLLVVAGFLTLIQKAPWEADHILALKRVILVSFPASMSATISDIIK
jgi:uncharacterized membrane protein